MTTTLTTVYSKLFLDEEDLSWSARPNRRLLEWLHADDENSARWIAVLGGVRICLGDPVRGQEERARELYVPQWILDSAGFGGEGDELRIRFERSESLAKATKLGFKIMGEIPEDLDIKELLEEPLSQLGVLKEGQILPAPVLEGVHLLVQTCEPAGQPVFLDGAEVGLEIEDDDAVIAARNERLRVAKEHEEQKAQEEETKKDDDFSAPMVSAAPPTTGKSKFVPFQGVGRRLCD
jgi:hypothetical protein